MRRFLLGLVLVFPVLDATVQAAPHSVLVGAYATDGMPLRQSEVRITSWSQLVNANEPPPQTGLTCMTDAAGECRLTLTGGTYKLSVFGPQGAGYQPKQVTFKVRTPRLLSVTLNK